jgi:hypothetical protein
VQGLSTLGPTKIKGDTITDRYIIPNKGKCIIKGNWNNTVHIIRGNAPSQVEHQWSQAKKPMPK